MDLLNDMIRAGLHGDCNCAEPMPAATSLLAAHGSGSFGRQRFIVAVVLPPTRWLTRRTARGQSSRQNTDAIAAPDVALRHSRPFPAHEDGKPSFLLT